MLETTVDMLEIALSVFPFDLDLLAFFILLFICSWFVRFVARHARAFGLLDAVEKSAENPLYISAPSSRWRDGFERYTGDET